MALKRENTHLVITTKLIADGVLLDSRRMNLFMIATFTDLSLRVGLARIFYGMWGQRHLERLAIRLDYSHATLTAVLQEDYGRLKVQISHFNNIICSCEQLRQRSMIEYPHHFIPKLVPRTLQSLIKKSLVFSWKSS